MKRFLMFVGLSVSLLFLSAAVGGSGAWIDSSGFISKNATHEALGRESGCWVAGFNTAATTFTAKGLAAAPAGPTGTPTAQPALTSATKFYVQYAGAASASAVAGWNGGAFTQTRPVYRPKVSYNFRTDSAITNRRIWAGITESTLATVAVAAGPTGSGVDFAAVGYEDGVNSSKPMCCSGDGSNYSCADMGAAAIAVSTEYTASVDFTVAGTLRCCIQAAGGSLICSSKATNLSATVTDIGMYLANTTTNSAAQNLFVNNGCLEHNP